MSLLVSRAGPSCASGCVCERECVRLCITQMLKSWLSSSDLVVLSTFAALVCTRII